MVRVSVSMPITSAIRTSTFLCLRTIERIGAAILIRREQTGGDLIEHRPEEVIVVLVDDRHVDRRSSESARGIESSEPASTMTTRGCPGSSIALSFVA